jgi:Tol biopolymer transport system component
MSSSAWPTRTRSRIGIPGLVAALTLGFWSLGAGAGPARADSSVHNGHIAYMRGVGDEPHVMLVEPDGTGTREVSLPQPAALPSWSADGSQLVVSTFVDDETIRPMIVDPANGSATILDVPEAPSDLALICRAWSPNGELLLCQGDSFTTEHPESNGIYTIRSSDGSGLTRLTSSEAYPPVFTDKGTCGGGDQPGGYSPDGSRFVFTRTKCGAGPVPDRNQSGAIYVADADGGHLTQLVPFGVAWSHEEGLARWSPDGGTILFAGAKGNLFTVSPDGGHMKQITFDLSGRLFAIAPDWSPDGSKIVLNLFTDGPSGIYTVDADGSNLALIAADGPDFVDEPDWGAAAP